MNIEYNFFSALDLDLLTVLEFEVYNYIRQNGSKIEYMTIRELSEEAHVSTTTILNFCHKMDCDGFSEFKVKFKLWKNSCQNTFLEPLDDTIQSFQQFTATKEFQARLDEVSQVIFQARNLITVGMGNSSHMAKYAANYFSVLGKFCSCIENPFFVPSPADLDGTVLMIFSISGDARNLLPLFHLSKDSSMKIISITNSSSNKMAQMSHYNIPYHVRYDILPGAFERMDFTTQIPVVYIIESLAKRAYRLSMDKEKQDVTPK